MLATDICGGEERSEQVDFATQIRPILSDNCFFCHGPDASHREGGLRLDQAEEAFSEGDSGETAIVPGKPDQSELLQRILSDDPDLRMPKHESGKQLEPDEVALIKRWIEEGASWDDHWAYRSPQKRTLPRLVDHDWSVNHVDQYIGSRLEKESLVPADDADLVTLVRRLHLDLTGLPPEPEVVEAFVGDSHPNRYERLVDRLLASPQFGERMAMYWLDLVRYADTVGYHGDQDHNISPFRDYVITSFNDNLPFDQFTREQLAGDLLAERKPSDRKENIRRQIASGYNRLLQTSHEGGVQKKEYLAIYAADRIRNVSGVWMGATMGCCQCHDHKFDPFTMRDFYSMAAFFSDIDEEKTFAGSNTVPTKREPEMFVFTDAESETLDAIQQRRETLSSQPEENKDLIEQLDKEQKTIESQARRTMITVAVEPRSVRILPRGNWLDESGPLVEPAVPEFMGAIETGGRRADRLDLANWLTDIENGCGLLTSRVFVNRLWYLFFGRGLARQLDDFGGQGVPPSHAELLDHLALDFVEANWDIKQTVRSLVLSRAYRLSSRSEAPQQEDPENIFFARQNRSRFAAETIRDVALAISGLLQEQRGGDSVKPYQPPGYYRHLNFPERSYHADADDRQWRRGLYVHWQRQFLHPMLRAFDAPQREECTAERSQSNTPSAALVLLNDPTFIEAARVFAERILREGGMTDDARLAFAFQRAVSRKPDTIEMGFLRDLLRQSRQEYRRHPEAAEKLCQIGLHDHNDDCDPIDLAAWTTVARGILNMHETITRN